MILLSDPGTQSLAGLGGDVRVTLRFIDYGDPDGLGPRPFVHAVVTEQASEGRPFRIDGEDTGYVAVFGSACRYRISIIGAGTFTAEFLLERLADTSEDCT